MTISSEVNLPRSHVPRFPDRCVACGCSGPGSLTRISAGKIGGWGTWLFWWLQRPFIVRAPACNWCGWKLHRLRLLSSLITISIAVVALWYLWPYLGQHVPRALRPVAGTALVALFLMPLWVLEALFASPFNATVHPESVDYEFTAKDYALEFVMLNSDAEWIRVNGEDDN